jgi:hypothetical protein
MMTIGSLRRPLVTFRSCEPTIEKAKGMGSAKCRVTPSVSKTRSKLGSQYV